MTKDRLELVWALQSTDDKVKNRLYSENRKYALELEKTGRLTLMELNTNLDRSRIIWQSPESARNPSDAYYMVLSSSGGIYVYNDPSKQKVITDQVWSSQTDCVGIALVGATPCSTQWSLQVTNAGILELRDDRASKAVWTKPV